MAVPAESIADVIVLGGGVCGLACAYHLAKSRHDVTLVEKENSTGGVIRTRRENQWLFELGPNSISFHENDDIHQLINELGLADELLMRPMRDSDRYIWRGGALRRVPVSPMQFLRKNALSRRTIIRAATGTLCRHSIPDHDISVGAFFSPSLGRKAVDEILAPALAGIYATDPFLLSMEAVMPRLFHAAKGQPSLAGALRSLKQRNAASSESAGKRMLASFRDGMASLTNTLAQQSAQAGAKIITSFEILSLERADNKIWKITDAAGRAIYGRNIICTLPAPATSNLLRTAAPDAAKLLAQFQYSPIVTACVGAIERDVTTNYDGFGFLAVRNSGLRSLGMIWNDRMFPARAPDGHRLFTAYLGGHIDFAANQLSDEELIDAIKKDLRLAMKWHGEELTVSHISRIPAALPLMEVGHMRHVRAVQDALPENLAITGNYVSGVSVPSCIRAAAELANRIAKKNPKS